jgi:hypothetical protein
LPKLEDLAYGLVRPMTIGFYNKEQLHAWTQKSPIVGWLLRQIKFLHDFESAWTHPINSHVFYHSYYPFPCFFVQVMIFYKTNYMILSLKLKSNQHIPWSHLWHIGNTWRLHDPTSPYKRC